MKIRDDDPPKEALRRLIGYAEQLPLPPDGEASCHLFEAKERFSLLRRLGVESVCLAHQARLFDSSLLLEVGALTTNRLIALVEALADPGFSAESFFDLMNFRVDSHREMDATWPVRTRGLQALIAAQGKWVQVERAVLFGAGKDSVALVRRDAADYAVYIAFFLEALRRGVT